MNTGLPAESVRNSGDVFMQKYELIEKIAAEAGIPKAAAGRALGSLLDSVTRSLKGGERVSLAGFGVFSVARRAARTGRNPRTGESVRIKARKVPKFTAAKGLKDAVK